MNFFQSNNFFDRHNVSESSETFFYTLAGQEDFYQDNIPCRNIEDQHVYAKKIKKIDGKYKYSIKLTNNGKLYNPISIYSEEKINTFLDRTCRSSNKFKTVNEKAFNFYLQFLTSKNIAYYYNAEREVD